MIDTCEVSTVEPSGLDSATALAPMLPPAPPRLSTTAAWPMISGRRVVTSRAVASLPPPGGKGEMNFTVCEGKPLRAGSGGGTFAVCGGTPWRAGGGSADAGGRASAASHAAAMARRARCGTREADDMAGLLEQERTTTGGKKAVSGQCRVIGQMSQAARRHRSAAQGAARSQYKHTERIGKRCNAALRFDGQRRPTDDR